MPAHCTPLSAVASPSKPEKPRSEFDKPNCIICEKAEWGHQIVKFLGFDPDEWCVKGYGDALLAYAPERLVVVRSCSRNLPLTMLSSYRDWEFTVLAHIKSRAKMVLELEGFGYLRTSRLNPNGYNTGYAQESEADNPARLAG